MNLPDLVSLLERALADPNEEAAFFRALPDGIVYAHAPRSDDRAGLRLIQFVRPDGVMVLPVFSSRVKADVAAGNAARVIEITGRELMRATAGSTWMIDPNDAGCTLSPEDLASLLVFGELDRLGFGKSASETDIDLVGDNTPAVETFLSLLLRNLTYVHSAFLFRRLDAKQGKGPHVIAVAVAPDRAEAAARAIFAAALASPGMLRDPVAILDFDPDAEIPDFIRCTAQAPFFVRSPDAGAR